MHLFSIAVAESIDRDRPRRRGLMPDPGPRSRPARPAASVAVVALVLLVLALTAGRAEAQATGTKKLLVVPIEHRDDCGTTRCPPSASPGSLMPPRETASQWREALQAELDTYFDDVSYGELSWDVRVLEDRTRPSGWWKAERRLSEYARGSGGNFTGTAAIVRDAAEGIMSSAVRSGRLTRAELAARPYLLVIDNYGWRAGQAMPARVDYEIAGRLTPTYPALVAQGSSLRTTATVIRHELAHTLGLPDLYSAPRADVADADGDSDRAEWGPHRCDTQEPRSTAAPLWGLDGDCVGPWETLAWDWYGGGVGFGAYGRILAGWLPTDSPMTREVGLDFSGRIELEPVEAPAYRRPAVLRIPRLSSLALRIRNGLRLLLGRQAPFVGFQVECRRRIGADRALPGEGLVVSWIDETQDYPMSVVRSPARQRAEDAYLRPGERHENAALGVAIANRGFTDRGSCIADVNQQRVPIVAGAAVTPGLASRVAAGVDVSGLDRSLSTFAAGGVGFGRRTDRLVPPREGRRTILRFGYRAFDAPLAAGRATLRVAQPYTAPATCGDGATALGRVAGRTSLKPLAAGAAGTGALAWRPRRSGSAGLSVQLAFPGDATRGDDRVESAVAFQTHRLAGGRSTRRTTIRVSVPAGCKHPVSFAVAPLTAPKGWQVRIEGAGRAVRPGHGRDVTIAVTAPRDARAGTVSIPVAVSQVEPSHHSQDHEHAGHAAPFVGGLDVIARVVRGADSARPFRLPAAALQLPRPSLRGPLFAPPGATKPALTVACRGGETVAVIDGAVAPAGSGAVTLTLTSPTGFVHERAATLGDGGAFALDAALGEHGVWRVDVAYPGDVQLAPAAGGCSVTIGGEQAPPVARAPSAVSLACPEKLAKGDAVKVIGRIEPAHRAAVRVTRRSPSGRTALSTVESGDDGRFGIPFTGDELGDWTIEARWDGDGDHLPAGTRCDVRVGG